MIEVLLECKEDGSISSLSAKGHAQFARKGKDIVCAAVSSLLRTTAKVLEETSGIELIKTSFNERGNLAFSVLRKDCSGDLTERLKCVSDFVREGISLIEDEYPEHVILREK